MNKKDYLEQRKDLFERWKKARPEYKGEGKRFTCDGIADYNEWAKSKPKILFLLKESYAPEGEWEPSEGISIINTFSSNIARWRYVLKELFKNPAKELSFSDFELPPDKKIWDIALVEIKKLNEGKISSNYYDIRNYATQDKVFIREQIELINPQVIFCCGTYSFYEIIFEWKPNLIENNYFEDDYGNDCSFWIHNKRLVLYFYHPSLYLKENEKIFFELLCKMIKEGKAFERLKIANN